MSKNYIRSPLLVHWTGSKAERDPVHTLLSFLVGGFWLTPHTGKIRGGPNKEANEDILEKISNRNIENSKKTEYAGKCHEVNYDENTHFLCFSEIPINKADLLSGKFGNMGIVVSRDYVLERWGVPVQYVRNEPHEVLVRQYDNIVKIFDEILGSLEFYSEILTSIPSNILEETLQKVSGLDLKTPNELCDHLNHLISRLQKDPLEPSEARRSLYFIIATLQKMHSWYEEEFEYFDQNEWRILPTRSMRTNRLDEVGEFILDEPRKIKTPRHIYEWGGNFRWDNVPRTDEMTSADEQRFRRFLHFIEENLDLEKKDWEKIEIKKANDDTRIEIADTQIKFFKEGLKVKFNVQSRCYEFEIDEDGFVCINSGRYFMPIQKKDIIAIILPNQAIKEELEKNPLFSFWRDYKNSNVGNNGSINILLEKINDHHLPPLVKMRLEKELRRASTSNSIAFTESIWQPQFVIYEQAGAMKWDEEYSKWKNIKS